MAAAAVADTTGAAPKESFIQRAKLATKKAAKNFTSCFECCFRGSAVQVCLCHLLDLPLYSHDVQFLAPSI